MSELSSNNKDELLAQYHSDVELYKFYINFVLKLNAFHYALSVAVFSFLLSNKSEPYLEYLLAFPAIFSITIIGIGVFGYPAVGILNKGVLDITTELGLKTYPDFTTLKGLIVASIFIHILLLIGAAIMFCWLPVAPIEIAVPPE